MARVETAAPATSNTAKAATPAKAAAPPAKKEEKKEFSWEKKKPDPKDFMFSNLKGQVGDSAAGAQQRVSVPCRVASCGCASVAG